MCASHCSLRLPKIPKRRQVIFLTRERLPGGREPGFLPGLKENFSKTMKPRRRKDAKAQRCEPTRPYAQSVASPRISRRIADTSSSN